MTSAIRESGRSVLLMQRMTGSLAVSALRSTKRVCGSGPSEASTSSTTASTIDRPRSTSPPKSAWPGVSMMLIVMTSPPSLGWYFTAVFLARIVMPFSRSRSFESIMRSSRCSAACAANAPACLSMASTSVVLPWSTWATMATLRMSWRVGMGGLRFSRIGDSGVLVGLESSYARRADAPRLVTMVRGGRACGFPGKFYRPQDRRLASCAAAASLGRGSSQARNPSPVTIQVDTCPVVGSRSPPSPQE